LSKVHPLERVFVEQTPVCGSPRGGRCPGVPVTPKRVYPLKTLSTRAFSGETSDRGKRSSRKLPKV